jgi:hypothetical protein
VTQVVVYERYTKILGDVDKREDYFVVITKQLIIVVGSYGINHCTISFCYVTSHIHLRSDSTVKQPQLRESSVKHEARRAIPIHERTNMSVARYQIGSQSIFC